MAESKWINFELVVTDVPRKTKIYSITTKDNGFILGTIKWYGAWRCYAFYPNGNTIFELTCLKDITVFIENLMAERKLANEKLSNA